jgi:hypothetical protein
MKLSEAIRQGAALRPQAHGDYHQVLENGTVCTCALGAAYEAITGHVPPSVYDEGAGSIVDNAIIDATYANAYTYARIVRWNDEEGATREQIAAWLEEEGL